MTRLHHFLSYLNKGMDLRNAWKFSANPRKPITTYQSRIVVAVLLVAGAFVSSWAIVKFVLCAIYR